MGCCHSAPEEKCEQLLAESNKPEAYHINKKTSFSDLSMSSHSGDQLPSLREPGPFMESAFLCHYSSASFLASAFARQLESKETFADTEEETN